MNAKILKYELFSLFSLTIITLVVFYYRDTLPDNYLSISSSSSHGFFAYYGTSLLNFINYYSGPWVLVPCVFFTSFYIFIFSKRADWIDALNILSLTIFSLWTVYYLQPSLLGAGLFQVLSSAFSPFASFLLWMGGLVAFVWGAYRGDFTAKVKTIFGELKKIDLATPTDKVATLLERYLNLAKEKVSSKIKLKEIAQDEAVCPEKTKAPESLALEESKSFMVVPAPIANNQMPTLQKVSLVEEISSEDEEEDVEFASAAADDEVYVDESEIGLSLHAAKAADKFNEDKYYDLVKLASHKKGEQKFAQPDDKYFHDIINKIQAKLGEFKIQGRIINVLKGPVVDTFEWELGAGEKVSRLTVTAEDLTLALSGSPIRMVYPMKGRTTVGIEVPRNPREFIFLDDVISCKDYTQTAHQLPLAMGKDAFGEPVVVDLAAMPHMLVAGSTGAGKSVFINSILVSLLIKKSPNQMKLILIDPKQLELALYARLPHLLMPVITEAKTAATSLLWACQEMERRYSIMSEFGVRNIEGFNHKLKRAP
ncbi:MAG: DUF87 domain-containing protein, partial [Alphaproteobacteria bacterium]